MTYQLTQEIKNQVKAANGKRKARILDECDVNCFFEKLNELANNETVHTIRVYAGQGFVPNSYKYRADISYMEAQRNSDGDFDIIVTTTDAKRSYGNGAVVTINGRAE